MSEQWDAWPECEVYITTESVFSSNLSLILLTILRRLLPPLEPLSFIESLKVITLGYIHSSCFCMLQWIELPIWEYLIETNSKTSILWLWVTKYLKLRMKKHKLQFRLHFNPAYVELGVYPRILRNIGKFDRFRQVKSSFSSRLNFFLDSISRLELSEIHSFRYCDRTFPCFWFSLSSFY